MSADVWLQVNGRRYGGWKSLTINSSINSQARAFAVSCTYDTPEGLTSARLQAGMALQVLIGSQVVVTGYIDAASVAYDANQISVQVSGRSKTCDLIDCTPAPPGTPIDTASSSWSSQPPADAQESKGRTAVWSWENSTVQEIITALAAPYGVSVRVLASELADKLTNFTVTPGQTVHQCIAKLVTIANLVITDDENGALVIAEPGSSGVCTDALESGQNVLSAEAANDVSKVMSSYQVLGQHKGGDDVVPADSCADEGLTADELIQRPRYLTIVDAGQQTSPAQCQEQADFEASYRAAQSKAFSMTVQGWQQTDGTLWAVNHLVQVNDPVLDRTGQFLITDVTMTLDDSGTLTKLNLMPLEGYRKAAATVTAQKATKPTGKKTAGAAGPDNTWADVKPIDKADA